MSRLRFYLNDIRTRQPRVIILTLVALAAVFLLASGISGLELLPGDPEAFNFVFRMDFGNSSLPGDTRVLEVFRIIYLIGLILFPFWLVYIIINPQARKRFLRDLLTFGSFLLLILLLISYLRDQNAREQEAPFEGFAGQSEQGLGEGTGNYLESTPPEQAVWIASLAVALVVVAIIAFVIWLSLRSRRKPGAVEKIAQQVQAALDDLQAGADLRNVVIRCYSQMVQALNENRGIQRSNSVTPREFEDTLQSLGFPLEPIHQLTRLFEGVRYGHKPVTRREELMAVDSLTAILDACRSSS